MQQAERFRVGVSWRPVEGHVRACRLCGGLPVYPRKNARAKEEFLNRKVT